MCRDVFLTVLSYSLIQGRSNLHKGIYLQISTLPTTTVSIFGRIPRNMGFSATVATIDFFDIVLGSEMHPHPNTLVLFR